MVPEEKAGIVLLRVQSVPPTPPVRHHRESKALVRTAQHLRTKRPATQNDLRRRAGILTSSISTDSAHLRCCCRWIDDPSGSSILFGTA